MEPHIIIKERPPIMNYFGYQVHPEKPAVFWKYYYSNTAQKLCKQFIITENTDERPLCITNSFTAADNALYHLATKEAKIIWSQISKSDRNQLRIKDKTTKQHTELILQ
jgi:hypothetical protein